jgi:hydroxymethylglutaryl-CoA lyase
MKQLSITECPRDAMQGITEFIPTDVKVNYLNQLLKVGFNVLDFGSFVSPKAIPQLADTAFVIDRLELGHTQTQLLSIVANYRGAEQAAAYQQISYIGFPLSVSETFQQRNTNKSIEQALADVALMQDLCLQKNKKLVVYLSMAFGNPYDDAYSSEMVAELADKLIDWNVAEIALADTIGSSNKESIAELFQVLGNHFPTQDFIAHLHSNPYTAFEKIEAAYEAGCTKFDTAMLGFGGCPMAKDDLTGNLATESLLSFARTQGLATTINPEEFEKSVIAAQSIFITH